MPLAGSGTVLGDAIVTALQGVDPSMSESAIAQLKTSWEAVGQAIVEHIVANALVSVTTTTSGVTGSGPPGGPLPIVAQPGTGTGTIE